MLQTAFSDDIYRYYKGVAKKNAFFFFLLFPCSNDHLFFYIYVVQKSDVDTDLKIESKNSEEEIRRRMVSDKLIPEVKLTFNVNTDTEVSQSQTSRETGKVGDVK